MDFEHIFFDGLGWGYFPPFWFLLILLINGAAKKIQKFEYQKNAVWTGLPLWLDSAAVTRFLSL